MMWPFKSKKTNGKKVDLVQFPDGLYGIRRRDKYKTEYEYKDLKHVEYWWDKNSTYFYSSCRATFDQVMPMFKKIVGDEIIVESGIEENYK